MIDPAIQQEMLEFLLWWAFVSIIIGIPLWLLIKGLLWVHHSIIRYQLTKRARCERCGKYIWLEDMCLLHDNDICAECWDELVTPVKREKVKT